MHALKTRVSPVLQRLSRPVLERFGSGLNSLLDYSPKDKPPYDPPSCPKGMETGPPDFVGIGAQKSGTSRWYVLMRSHPEIFLPDFSDEPYPDWYTKERHFFDDFFQSEFGAHDIEAYHRWFPRPGGTITGEWTPQYCVDPWVAPLLAQAAPHTKVLMFLRDPVRRFASGMAHSQRYNTLGTSSAIEHYARGLYAQQLEYWFKYFPRANFLILQFEQTLQDPAAGLRGTFQFLGLREIELPDQLFEQEVNTRMTRTNYTIPAHFRDTLVERYTDEVLHLKELVPDLDLRLWPHFAHLA